MDEKYKRDRIFLICQIAAAVLGAAVIIVKGNYFMLGLYVPFMVISVPMIYFCYSLCKWQNQWHADLNEKNPCDGEPSDFLIRRSKIGAWALYIIALLLPLLPAGLL